ncbi:outer membrane beta-barrel protein [Qingshengfaniella alkalisoli]|uniref:Outer membrane beta-barrel protein n=1 Tax=Qingshengfaniella alkalisoli TaxID=2599296 RepID=A0A5B8IYN4_9RHOB|nr:outer membrane beta-barrel protein [Qingshengfaniella alkalisoli]QDY69768.1 hypothetical protein FPZ52_09140 [Qingshengfaniella alkalisoli]
MKRTLLVIATVIPTVSAVGVPFLFAQERTEKSAYISSSIEANDNYDLREDSAGDALIWNNSLGAALFSRTRTDLLDFRVDGTLRASDLPVQGQEAEFDDPRLRFNFSRNVDDNAIDANLFYRRVDVDFFDPLSSIDDDGNFDDTQGDGYREELRAGAGVALNSDGPLSFALNGNTRRVNYVDTTDPDLSDYTSGALNTEFGFRLNPIFTATLGGGYSQREYDDPSKTDRESATADLGFNATINPTLRAQFRLGYSQVDSTANGNDSTEEGLVGSLNLQREVKNGTIRLGFTSDLDENGTRNRVFVGRDVTFRNGASFDSWIGASANDTTDIEPVGAISYTHTLPLSEVTLGLNQNATVDDESRNVLNTSLFASYSRVLTKVSSVGLDVSAGRTIYENSDQDTKERLSISTSYSHSLTREWDITGGYRYKFRDSGDDDDAQSNALFLTLTRSFESSR